MHKKLNNGYWPVLVLTIVVLASTFLLALTNEVTAPKREAVAKEKEMASKKLLIPDAAEFAEVEIPEEFSEKVDLINLAKDENGNNLGLIIQARAKGYNGDVAAMMAYDLDGNSLGIFVPDNKETPGLGQKVKEEAFYQQYNGKTVQDHFSPYDMSWEPNVDKNFTWHTIDAVSGATMSSIGISDAVNLTSEVFLACIEEVK